MHEFKMKITPRKRVRQHAISRVKRKQNKKDVNMTNNRDSIDQISQLPDPVIHHILSFLCTKDACRTSILSKKWRNIWNSFPILDFNQRYFKNDLDGQLFHDTVNSCLVSRCQGNLSIQKFKLYIIFNDAAMGSRINIWVFLATKCNAKELDLQLKKANNFRCPELLLTANKITALKLHGCNLCPSYDIKLPLLQKLNLGGIKIDQTLFESFISNCPLIEDLRLVYCIGLKEVKILNLTKLTKIELHKCRNLQRVFVIVPNLQTFWYFKKKHGACDINLSGCRTIKRLTLVDHKLSDTQIINHITSFPCLENLVLSGCNNLKHLEVSSEELRSFSLRNCMKLLEAKMATPKLHSFDYKGGVIPLYFTNTARITNSKLTFTRKSIPIFGIPPNSFVSNFELIKLLEAFDHSPSGLKMVAIYNKKTVIVCDELQQTVFPLISGLKAEMMESSNSFAALLDAALIMTILDIISNLKVEIIKSSKSFEDVLYDVIQSGRPDRLCLISSSSSHRKLSKFMEELADTARNNPSCCGFNAKNKCWRHYLKKVRMLKKGFGSAGIGSASPLIVEWLNEFGRRTCNFELKWKAREPCESKCISLLIVALVGFLFNSPEIIW